MYMSIYKLDNEKINSVLEKSTSYADSEVSCGIKKAQIEKSGSKLWPKVYGATLYTW